MWDVDKARWSGIDSPPPPPAPAYDSRTYARGLWPFSVKCKTKLIKAHPAGHSWENTGDRYFAKIKPKCYLLSNCHTRKGLQVQLQFSIRAA